MKPSLKYCIYCTCEKYVRNKVRKRANPFPQHGISGFYSLVFFVTFQSLEKLSLPLSLKSSTSMTSVMSCGGERLSTLWTVLSRDDQPSLWKGMMILVLGSFSAYSFCLQLDTHVHRQNRNRCSTLANTYINTAYSRKDKSILFISCILPGIILVFFFFFLHTCLFSTSQVTKNMYIYQHSNECVWAWWADGSSTHFTEIQVQFSLKAQLNSLSIICYYRDNCICSPLSKKKTKNSRKQFQGLLSNTLRT